MVVASVSCIYGLGAPDSYYDMLAYLEVGDARGMPALLAQLVEMQYERTNMDLARGTFRVRGDVLEVAPAYEDTAVRVEFFGDEIEKITRTDPLRGTPLQRLDRLALYPRTFYATPRETLERAIRAFHMEAIRFRMHAVDRLIGVTGDDALSRRLFEELRATLEAAGFHTRSHAAPGS